MRTDDSAPAHSRIDASGFDAFCRSAAQDLLRSAWLLTGDRGLAEDLLQTTLLKVWRHWTAVTPQHGARVAYARKTLVNTFVSSRRRLRPKEVLLAQLPDGQPQLAEDRADRHALLAALGRLSPRQRAVIVLRYFDDQSEAATAALLGCSVGTVKTQGSRAIRKLRSMPDVKGLRSA